jgi:NAD(P)-dependent dehydrogenase (short-subunit alcohol dehydrogenase family)
MTRVLITGTSTGIGKAVALFLARAGYEVVATMRTPDKSDLPQIARSEELPLTVSRLDVDDPESVVSCFAEAKADGAIDVLINNAGIFHLGTTEDLPIDVFERTINTNYLGAMRCIQAVLPEMRERGSGSIINITSVAGRLAAPAMGSYTAAKHALEAATEALAAEVKQHGIKVALVEPGIIETPMTTQDKLPTKSDPRYPTLARIHAIFDSTLAGEPGQPDVVAEVVQNVLDDETGQLRWPVGPDSAAFLAWRATMNDEEWVACNGVADDETWYQMFEDFFGADIRAFGAKTS